MNRYKFFLSLRQRAKNHKKSDPIISKMNVEINPIFPDIHIVFSLKRVLVSVFVFLLPVLFKMSDIGCR
jgi:hypothetical protein